MSYVEYQSGQIQTVANIYCIGRNYAEHARELGNQVEAEPVVFLKPTSALHREEDGPLRLPDIAGEIHHECELVLLIGQGGRQIKADHALPHIAAYGLGLDLTARDLQNQLKAKGLPWTLAKGFDGSAAVSRFVPASEVADPLALDFELSVNGSVRQRGEVRQMVHSIPDLLCWLSRYFTLQAGDLIFTGTPAGVAALQPGDKLAMRMQALLTAQFVVS